MIRRANAKSASFARFARPRKENKHGHLAELMYAKSTLNSYICRPIQKAHSGSIKQNQLTARTKKAQPLFPPPAQSHLNYFSRKQNTQRPQYSTRSRKARLCRLHLKHDDDSASPVMHSCIHTCLLIHNPFPILPHPLPSIYFPPAHFLLAAHPLHPEKPGRVANLTIHRE
jgi:hypothetical protein